MRRTRPLIALAIVCISILLPVSSRAAGWSPRAANYPGAPVVERDVRVTMSDGIRLAVDVIHPSTAGKAEAAGEFPVLVTQTPYNKLTPLNFRTDYMVQRGYVQVIADVRGTGGSEGVWDSFGTREQLDGKEIVEWAGAQPWSDGRIGLHGTSYGAINQILTAAQHPAGLRATFPIVPMADAYRDITGSGGQINTSFIPSWLGLVTALGLLPPTYAATDPVGAATTLASHGAGAINFQAGTVLKAMTGGDQAFDGPFYRQRSPIEVIDRVEVPTFIVGGWFDLFQRGEPMLFNHLRSNGVPTRLLMGPWYHVDAGLGAGLPADDVRVPSEYELRWMDHYVRDVVDPELDTDVAPVTMFRLGGGHYETASQWPPANVTFSERFLSGPAVGGVQHGALASAAPATQDADTMIWQPASGVCSRSIAQWTAAGSQQGCEADQRTNEVGGLTYDLPAPDGLSLAGPIAAKLFVSTNGRDAFVTARIEDVAPDGKVTQLTAGWNVLSMRAVDLGKTLKADGLVVQPYHPFTRASMQPVVADAVEELWVEIFPTAALIAPGHTLRLSLQPSDAPHLSAPLPQLASLPGVLKLYHDVAHPSSVVLPVQ
jgi:hypothetical protein